MGRLRISGQPPESPEARRLRLAAEAEQELLLVEVEQRRRDEAERRWLHREWLAQQEFQARLALKRPPTPPAAEAAAATDEEETRPPSARARDVRREQLDAYLSTVRSIHFRRRFGGVRGDRIAGQA